MNESILSAIGDTPLVRLSRVFENLPFELYAKIEALNPGGSIKDRPAVNIIKRGMETGEIGPGTVVIESSSGNMGIGLAMACAYFGLRFICVVDPKTTAQNIKLLEAYGAEVDMVQEPDPQTGEFLQARINRVRFLLGSTANAFWPDQYANPFNPIAHHQTMREIVAALGRVDYLFCSTSTCGTLRGCAEYIQDHHLPTKIIAVDAQGSIIFGGCRAKRLIPGHGSSVLPPLFQLNLADECVHLSDLDCVVGCRLLVRREAILAGGSSGAVLMAVDRIKDRIPVGSVCVALFPDRGERYLDTIYSNAWVMEHFAHEAELWKEDKACATVTY